MDTSFQPTPHAEAAEMIAGKTVLAKKIFMDLLPELRARAFTVAGIEDMNLLEQIRDEVAALPKGQTWTESKKQISAALAPALGEEGADKRAELVLRANAFPAFSASSWRAVQADDETTHLQYLHGDCQVPTPSHLALNGLILPKDDPFWDTHTGPWGHLGCVCYFRGMSPDQVDLEKDADAKRAPEEKLVMEGPALTKLNEGTLIRGPRSFDVSPPTGENAYHFHPDDLRIPLGDLKLRYDPEVFDTFEQSAKRTLIAPGLTLWNWLNSKPSKLAREEQTRIDQQTIRRINPPEALHKPLPFSGPSQSRIGLEEAKAKIQSGFAIKSSAGTEVKFGQILHNHFQRGADDQRPRFLPNAIMAARNPVEVWQKGLRRYYIGRLKGQDGKSLGFIVIATRVGESADEVITFYPKNEKELKKFRQGDLIYSQQ